LLGYAPALCCTDEDIDGIIERTPMTLEDKDVRTVTKGRLLRLSPEYRAISADTPAAGATHRSRGSCV
jgi:hypothetical protein